MERIGRKQEKSLSERKTSIPYDKIDKGILKTIRLLNKFPFCITTSCCQGHPESLSSNDWVVDSYITLEVTDEAKFLEMFQEICFEFEKVTEHRLNLNKSYFFNINGNVGREYHWRVAFWFGFESKEVIEKNLLKCRNCLERLLHEYQERHKDVLDR